jgi:LCP family protein required for cell wall assembly
MISVIAIVFAAPYLNLVKDTLNGPVNFFSLISPQRNLLKNDNGRTNVLLLGVGGRQHDGPDLTDSMMIVSVNTDPTKNPKPPIILISLPRDIYLPELENKINAAYDQGNKKKPGSGLILTKSVVNQITGLPIHYAVLVDFSGFERAVDLLGGIDVTITHAFDDFQYPISGKENDICGGDPDFKCRYEHLHFDKGQSHLDGSQALKFARSRYAIGDEGTDFARAARQQLILEAIKAKVVSSKTFLDPQRMKDIYHALKQNIVTDLNPDEMGTFIKIGLENKTTKTKSIILVMDFFDNPPIDARGWILLPKDPTWKTIHNFIDLQISESDNQGPQKN